MLSISREQFLDRYDKDKTKEQAIVSLVAWDRFVTHMLIPEPELFEQMLKNEKQKYLLLDHMIQFWKKARHPKDFKRMRHPTTINTYYIYVISWLKMNEIDIDTSKARQYIKFPKAIRERVRGIDHTMIERMYVKAEPFYKALIIILSCTGMRISEVLHMRYDWIEWSDGEEPIKITIPGEFTKTGQERITFATPEARDWINELRENKKDSDIIFDKSYQSVWAYMDRLRKKCGYDTRGNNGIHHVRIHKLRGFAENKLARAVDSEYAHSILGHTKDLIQYNQGGTTDKEAADDYKLAIPALTIIPNKVN